MLPTIPSILLLISHSLFIIIICFTALHKWRYKRFGEREMIQADRLTPTTGAAEELLHKLKYLYKDSYS